MVGPRTVRVGSGAGGAALIASSMALTSAGFRSAHELLKPIIREIHTHAHANEMSACYPHGAYPSGRVPDWRRESSTSSCVAAWRTLGLASSSDFFAKVTISATLTFCRPNSYAHATDRQRHDDGEPLILASP